MSTKKNDSLGAHLLRAWRKKEDLSQNELGKLLEIDLTRISNFERGSQKPGRTTSCRISEVTHGFVPVSSWDMEPPYESAAPQAKDSGQ